MAKPISKFFRVALEGATTDGRVIDRPFIEQMAATFNRELYGARVWLEHLRGTLPDSPFKAYGDVLAVKAEEVVLGGVKKLALFAQISPTPELIAMNKARQKIYTSIEINPKFSDTGEAYLVGLAVTDSPASLGTEILSFAAQHPEASPFANRKQSADNLFSVAVETELEFEDDTPSNPEGGKLSAMVKNLFKKVTTKDSSDEARFSDVATAIEAVAAHTAGHDQQFTDSKKRIDTLEAALTKVTTDFAEFKQQIDTEDGNTTTRPAATGGSSDLQTDF